MSWAMQRQMDVKDVGYYTKKNGDIVVYDKRSFYGIIVDKIRKIKEIKKGTKIPKETNKYILRFSYVKKKFEKLTKNKHIPNRNKIILKKKLWKEVKKKYK